MSRPGPAGPAFFIRQAGPTDPAAAGSNPSAVRTVTPVRRHGREESP